ncbi:MAG: STAS domain-containing protein [Elainellaceae cyanobacterium]
MQQKLNSLQTETCQLSGHINASSVDECQKTLIDALSSSSCSTFVVDMQNVESLDSAGLMALVAALNFAQDQGKAFTVTNVSDALRIIFELTQLDQAFVINEGTSNLELAAA